ncbi:M48 family metalloprotease [Oryzibacter oryziterrae]|uniref:M48 family metalloprotease n=1 Tax=Oryzibacter oryziterrae TaxID=2766474 RepID=UPI001F01AFC1|nr:M48 family metalloprotease [Oryzibacter oryziterrae]
MTRRLRRSLVAGLTVAALAFNALAPAMAAERTALLRDAEAETLIGDFARPILKAAGLGAASIQVRIVDDPMFNAFVADSRHIYINSGALLDCKTPNEIIGVIAHETGHLAANHLSQLRKEISRMQILSAIAMIGGAAAGIASGNGRAGVAAAMGGMQIGQRSLLSYAREQETSADMAGLKFLDKTGQSANGMLETFKRLADQQLFSAGGSDPYIQTHPMPADRIAQIDEAARKSKYFGKADSPDLQARYDLVRAKFLGFTASPQQINRQYPTTDTSLPARYARAIMTYRYADPASATARVDDLIESAPNNPYFWELKGQILLETGSPAKAVEPLKKAVSLAPNAGLIRVLYGQALIGTGSDRLVPEAIAALTKGIGDDPDQPIGYRQLAIAYAKTGDTAMADLATAQGSFAVGDIKAAKQYALRAQGKLKVGSPGWLRADDIITYKVRN